MTKRYETSRRRFLIGSGLAAGALAAPAIVRPTPARASGEVNVWAYANFIPDAFREQFEADTGIKINIRLVDDQGKQFNLLAAEAPNPTVDIVTIAGHRFKQFIDSALLAPLDTGRLANWATVDEVYREANWTLVNGEKWGVPILAGAEGLAYNTEIVSAEEADSWDVMFADTYAGQTAYIVQDMMSVVMLYLGYDGNMIEYMDDPDKAAAIVAEARDFMIAHKDKVRKFYDSGAEVQQMFINQDIVLAQGWSGPISKLIMDGFPVDFTIPKEGSYGFVYNFNVTNNGPNTDNAYRLLDAMLASPEIGASMTKASGFISTFAGSAEYLNDLERKAASFSDVERQRLQFFESAANEMKYNLVDPAVEQVKAA